MPAPLEVGSSTSRLRFGHHYAFENTDDMLATPSKTRPAGSTGALQFRDAFGKFKGTSGLTFSETTGTLAFVGSAQTANNPLLDLSQTWNNAAVAFSGVRFNAIGGATSGAASKLLDLQLDGSSKFFVNKSGDTTVGAYLYLGNANQYIRSTGSFIEIATYGSTGVSIYGGANGYIGLSGSPGAAPDALLFRDAAGIFAQRNGVNAQAFRVYNTFTDASNGEWGAMRWNAGILEIGGYKNGTGATRTLRMFGSDGSSGVIQITNGLVAVGPALSIGYGSGPNGPAVSDVVLYAASSGVLRLSNSASTDFARLCLGGLTASFPAIKRSGATVQARLADDTGFTFVQGKLQTDAPAVIETLVLVRSITLYDSTGTAYKVPCT